MKEHLMTKDELLRLYAWLIQNGHSQWDAIQCIIYTATGRPPRKAASFPPTTIKRA